MRARASRLRTETTLALCTIVTFIFFLIGSFQVLTYLVADARLPRSTQLGLPAIELAAVETLVISLIALPLGYVFMYFFGGVVSTRAIRLYLYLFRGKSVVASKSSDLQKVASEKGIRLQLKRQLVYFAFIIAVVVSFAIYMSKHGVFPIVSPLTRTSDVITLITQDYITLTMSGSLMVPVVALALPYFGGLRLRTIDVGPFHTSLLTFVIGASGGFTLLYSILAKPVVTLLVYYLLLFMGVCWCFAVGCNLGAEPAHRQIAHDVMSTKNSSKLISSRIWLENAQGKFVEV